MESSENKKPDIEASPTMKTTPSVKEAQAAKATPLEPVSPPPANDVLTKSEEKKVVLSTDEHNKENADCEATSPERKKAKIQWRGRRVPVTPTPDGMTESVGREKDDLSVKDNEVAIKNKVNVLSSKKTS